MTARLWVVFVSYVLAAVVIGYILGFDQRHGLTHAVTMWAILIVAISVGMCLRWFFGGSV